MRTVTLSDEAYYVLCGLVQPSDDVNPEGIFSPAIDELRNAFPIEAFVRRATGDLEFYDPHVGE